MRVMKEKLCELVRIAGEKVLSSRASSLVTKKADSSPLTLADMESHKFLLKNLPSIMNIPVLSEEARVSYKVRNVWDEFWLIDPLDGTKDFLAGLDEFCINIALIKQGKPIVGLILAPALNELYYAESGEGFVYEGLPHVRMFKGKTIGALSRFHNSLLTKKFLELNKIDNTQIIGAALKFGRLALGLVDIYPRFEGSKEWDTAAGHLIVKESGRKIIDLVTKCEPMYNKASIENNYFIACANEIALEKLKIPEVENS